MQGNVKVIFLVIVAVAIGLFFYKKSSKPAAEHYGSNKTSAAEVIKVMTTPEKKIYRDGSVYTFCDRKGKDTIIECYKVNKSACKKIVTKSFNKCWDDKEKLRHDCFMRSLYKTLKNKVRPIKKCLESNKSLRKY